MIDTFYTFPIFGRLDNRPNSADKKLLIDTSGSFLSVMIRFQMSGGFRKDHAAAEITSVNGFVFAGDQHQRIFAEFF